MVEGFLWWEIFDERFVHCGVAPLVDLRVMVVMGEICLISVSWMRLVSVLMLFELLVFLMRMFGVILSLCFVIFLTMVMMAVCLVLIVFFCVVYVCAFASFSVFG